ncbi:MAG: hypothetical protein LUG19_00595 [Desulfovibrio sp.]|uniref:hypothetical protein n=1 Tax=Desulfovibrio sp. TaxID=885 RepID=UPI00258A3622|nr:hypothetical protein [Desulfovibrio sp.]MCD7982735.1 hypothetical protein [Desulfovibrio sp.]
MDITAYMFQTVPSDAVFSLAALFTRWQYRTAKNIITELYTRIDENQIRSKITFFELTDLYYQKEHIEPWNYKGFVFKMEAILLPDEGKVHEHIKKFPNIFVLKEDIFAIEKFKRDYCLIPGGYNPENDFIICNKQTLPSLGPQIFIEICAADQDDEFREKLTRDISFPQQHLWPWLGPVITHVPHRKQGRKNTVGHDLEEVTEFIRTARELGQNDPRCLAKMLNYRYPNISLPTMVNIIEPDEQRNPSTATKTARRWLFDR